MKAIIRLLLLGLVLVGIGFGVNYFTPVPRVMVQVWGLNLGVIKVADADWGLLKLRSGKVGLDALRDLEQHGATDKIRQTSVAVQDQWLEAGHVSKLGGGHLYWEVTQDKETRFNELKMPLDGKTLRQDLRPSQYIPENFWRDQQFRMGCQIPPKSLAPNRTDSCILRMLDMTGDNQPEIIVDHTIMETNNYEILPVAREEWVIYIETNNGWKKPVWFRFCDVPQSHFSAPKVAGEPIDIVSLNGNAMNFFAWDCFPDNVTNAPDAQAFQASRMAGRLKDIPSLLANGHKIPESLIIALSHKAVITADVNWPILKLTEDEKLDSRPKYAGMPPCFIASDPKACVVIVTDIDHDGTDDVIVVDRQFHEDGKDYRLATLLMFRDQHWQIMANQPICATEHEDIGTAKITVARGKWRPVNYSGHLHVYDDDPSGGCTNHIAFL